MSKSKFHKASIFYFSGTGNAEKVCNWIAEEFEKAQIITSIFHISNLKRNSIDIQNAQLIGFCSPTHGFNFPPIMLHFIMRFPKGNGQSVFISNTRAGMKMGKWFLPGLSGIAQLFPALVLMLKGYKIVGMRPIDMPSNWISIHPGIKEKVVYSIMDRCKAISKKFASKIACGKNDLRALFDIIQDLLIAPVSIGYYLIGRFVFAKSFYADRNCTKCFKCIKDCPVGAIKKIDSRPYWTHNCESCMHCMNNCPADAIQTAHGFVVGIFYIVISIGMKYGWNALLKTIDHPLIETIYQSGMLKFTVDSVVALVFLMFAYRIMHVLLKIPVFERIISYTSLTGYKFWGRYKGNKIKIV